MPACIEFTELENTAVYYDAVMTLMELYRGKLALDVAEARHESLVTDFEGEASRLCAFLGLEFHEAMHAFAGRARGAEHRHAVLRPGRARTCRRLVSRNGGAMARSLNLFFPCWRRSWPGSAIRRIKMPRPTNTSGRGSSRRPHRGGNDKGGPSQRQLRVGEALRHALAEVLNRNEIRDPDLDGVSVTVTQIKPSPDMRYATVYCEPLGGQNAKQIIAALNRHKGFLRGEMGHMIDHEVHPRPALCRRRVFCRSLEDRDHPALARSSARSDRA